MRRNEKVLTRLRLGVFPQKTALVARVVNFPEVEMTVDLQGARALAGW
jgi:hypothetical protein